MKKTQTTYSDSITHSIITLARMIMLVVMTIGCFIMSTYMVNSWFDTISIFTIPLVVLLVVVISGIMISFGIMIILLTTFVIDEWFERRWEKTHEKINK